MASCQSPSLTLRAFALIMEVKKAAPCGDKEDIVMTPVLCYISLLIIPVCSFLLGLWRRTHCREMHARLGYTSDLALASPHAWACAQRASSLRYMIVSVVLAAFSLWAFTVLPANTPAAMGVSALMLVMLEVLTMIVVIVTVETTLRRLVHPQEKASAK